MKITATIVSAAKINVNKCNNGFKMVTLDYAVKDCTGRVIHVSEKHKPQTALNKLPFYTEGREVEIEGREVIEHVRGNKKYNDLRGYGWLK